MHSLFAYVELKTLEVITILMPVGWYSWFVAGLVRLRLQIRPLSKTVDFHDTENRQWPCQHDYAACLRFLQCLFGLGAIGNPWYSFT
ncbi:hypothetical protein TNCV_527471 [Trichonephila clavipes]|nr:hypothetical protein TNCV_527471 [Trichonephila clavipes]